MRASAASSFACFLETFFIDLPFPRRRLSRPRSSLCIPLRPLHDRYAPPAAPQPHPPFPASASVPLLLRRGPALRWHGGPQTPALPPRSSHGASLDSGGSSVRPTRRPSLYLHSCTYYIRRGRVPSLDPLSRSSVAQPWVRRVGLLFASRQSSQSPSQFEKHLLLAPFVRLPSFPPPLSELYPCVFFLLRAHSNQFARVRILVLYMDLTNLIIHGIVSREFSTPSSPNVPVPSQIPSGSGLISSLCFAFNFQLWTFDLFLPNIPTFQPCLFPLSLFSPSLCPLCPAPAPT